MINRIRDIRRSKGITLAQLARRCSPKTTPQTIGRLETGRRNLSISWMDRIASALDVDPKVLIRTDQTDPSQIVAKLHTTGPIALDNPIEALLPSELVGNGSFKVLIVEESVGEYRPGDQLWLRLIDAQFSQNAINRDVLIPRTANRFAFGRLINTQGSLVAILPPGIGQKQLVVDNPSWIAVADLMIRKL